MNFLGKLICVCVLGLFVIGSSFGVNKNDRLGQSYDRSHNASSNPYASDLEADDLFNTNISVGTGGIGQSESVLVRMARFLMRIAVMLGVPLLLFAAIKIAFSLGDESKLKEALKQIGMLVLGLLLILFSVMIVFLITSLTRSSLPLFSS